MRVGKILAMTPAVLALGLAPMAAAETCKPRYVEAARTPGVPVGSTLREVRNLMPKTSECRQGMNAPKCVFTDARGVTYVLKDRGEEGYVTSKTLNRRGRPGLPFGVTWDDPRETIVAKFKGAGVTLVPRGRSTLETGFCFLTRDRVEAFRFRLTLSATGELRQVAELVDAPY